MAKKFKVMFYSNKRGECKIYESDTYPEMDAFTEGQPVVIIGNIDIILALAPGEFVKIIEE